MTKNYIAIIFVTVVAAILIAINELTELSIAVDYGFMIIIAAVLIAVGISRKAFFKPFYKS